MSVLYLLVGGSASQRGELGRDLVCYNKKTLMFSADEVGKALYGDCVALGDPVRVSNVLKEKTVDALLRGVDVVYNTDSTSRKSREGILAEIPTGTQVVCFVFSGEGLPGLSDSLEVPTLNEGIDEIYSADNLNSTNIQNFILVRGAYYQ